MKKDIFWNSLGVSAWSFLSLFLLIVVTRINGIADSGLFSFAFAVAMIMFTVGCFGGRAYQVSDHKNLFTTDSYISLRILTSLVVVALTLLFIFANGYDLYKSALIIILVGQRVFDAIADVFYGIMQKKKHLYVSGKSLFYKSVLSLVVFIVIDLGTKNLLLASLSLPVISLIYIIFYDIPMSRKLEKFHIRLRSSEIKRIATSTFLPFAVTAMGLIFANLARYFIDIYHPNLQGYFGIIIMPLSLVILLFSFISTPAILHLSNKFNNKEFHILNQTMGKITGLTAGATLLLCILTYFIGGPALKLLFSVDFSNYILDIILVIVIGFFLSITSLFTNISIIARKLRVTSIIYLAVNVLLVLMCMVLVKPYEIHGAILAYIIVSAIQMIAMGIYYLYLTKKSKIL